MATVTVIIHGAFGDVEDVRLAMERVLSVTGGEMDTDERMLHDDGTLSYTLTVSADETPGGPDEYEFSRIKDPAVYVNLRDLFNEAWRDLNYLKDEGVVNPEGTFARELEVFRAKMDAYLRGLEG